MQTAAEERRTPDLQVPAMPAVVTEKAVRTYLADLTDRGRSADTVRMYASRLRTLWEDLPPDKQVRRETLADWQDTLLDRGYSPGTVNTHLSAANGLLEHMGRRDLQLVGQLDVVPEVQPELTRTEYLRLLQTARTEVERSVRLLAEQAYERMLDTEQLAVGWNGA